MAHLVLVLFVTFYVPDSVGNTKDHSNSANSQIRNMQTQKRDKGKYWPDYAHKILEEPENTSVILISFCLGDGSKDPFFLSLSINFTPPSEANKHSI